MVNSTLKADQVLIHGFFKRYPSESAGHLNALPVNEVLRLLQTEKVSVAAKVFIHLNPDVADKVLSGMKDLFFMGLFSELDPVQGAVILARLDKTLIQKRLALLPENLAKEYRELISYPPETAGYLMDPRVTVFKPGDTIAQVLTHIRAIGDRRIIDLCVVDEEGILIGTVPLQHVAVAQPSQPLEELLQRDPVTVHMLDPKEDIVQLLEDRKVATLPVTNLDGKLLGVIRHDALVVAAQQDASQDLQSMFGAGRDERALSKVSFAILKRLPWLEINLATAFLAATVVGLFEDTIAKFTALAIFLPVVAGQSGNTGSQALAVTMRGLALREIRARHWFRVAAKEVAVGFFNGVIIALTTGFVVYWWMSSMGLALVIAASMIFSMVIAGLSGALIPILLQSVGQDPAQSSSIILTTVTDIVGFMSFLGLATLFAHMLQVS